MAIDIHWVAVLSGAVAAMLCGAAWYSPRVFGTAWREALGVSEEQLRDRRKSGVLFFAVRSFVLSFALFHIISVTAAFYSDKSFLSNAVGVGFWVGIGIVALTMTLHDYFDQRPLAATKIHVRFEVVTILVVSVVIGFIAG